MKDRTHLARKLVGLAKEILSSSSRHCAFYKATDGQWYMELGDFEHASTEDSTTYGPFDSEAAAEEYLENFSNPGSSWTDNKTRPVPKKSPNGRPVPIPQQSAKRTGNVLSTRKRVVSFSRTWV